MIEIHHILHAQTKKKRSARANELHSRNCYKNTYLMVARRHIFSIFDLNLVIFICYTKDVLYLRYTFFQIKFTKCPRNLHLLQFSERKKGENYCFITNVLRG